MTLHVTGFGAIVFLQSLWFIGAGVSLAEFEKRRPTVIAPLVGLAALIALLAIHLVHALHHS